MAVNSPPSESDSSPSGSVFSLGSKRGGGTGRDDGLVDGEGFVDDAENAGAESRSKSATLDRDVLGLFGGGAASPGGGL